MKDGNLRFRDAIRTLKQEAAALFKAAPEPMRAFQSLMTTASKDGVLSARMKELMALAISISIRCEGCILHHIDAARRHGASRSEIAETIAVALEMGGGPAAVYGAVALAAYDEVTAS